LVRTGPKELLVDRDSASCGRSWESTSEYKISLQRDHLDLVRFGKDDRNDLDRVMEVLDKCMKTAPLVIQDRLAKDQCKQSSFPIA
jgi:hypothetical protein